MREAKRGHQKGRQGLVIEGRDWTVEVSAGRAQIHAARPRTIEGGQNWGEQLGNGDRAFIKAIRTGKQVHVLSDYRSAVNTLAVTLAANASMQTGRPVNVRHF